MKSISSDLSSQNKDEQRDSFKNAEIHDSIFKKRRFSSKTHKKQNKSISFLKDQTSNSLSGEFRIYPLPTKNMLSVINGLKEIEDEIEDEE